MDPLDFPNSCTTELGAICEIGDEIQTAFFLL